VIPHVTSARHRAVVEKQPRSRATKIALPALAATVVTSSVVGFSVLGGSDAPSASYAGADIGAARSGPILDADGRERLADRMQSISRSAKRVTIEDRPVPEGHKFATVALNIRKAPAEDAPSVETVDPATKLAVTGEVKGDWAEVVWDKQSFWVAADYLAKKKPEEEEAAESGSPSVGGLSSAPCAAGASIEGGLTSSAVTVLRAVCAQFPQITSYGGYRGDGEHSDGRAIDIMISGEAGWEVADYLRANSSALGLYDIIYSQRIWTAERSSEGWRYMEDRGSTTANHYDHVHVKVF
jgi:hypothetical protein